MAFVNVEGEVTRLHSNGGGFGLKESWQAQGKDRHRFWAVFPKDPVQVNTGDRVKVSGGLQTSVTDPKPDSQGVERVYVDHVVGQAKVEVTGNAAGGAQNSWGTQSPTGGGNVAPSAQGNAMGGGFGGYADSEEPF